MDPNGNVTTHHWCMMVYWRVGCTVQERTSGKTMMVGWVKTKEAHGILWYFDFRGLWIVYASIRYVWLISIASKWAKWGCPQWNYISVVIWSIDLVSKSHLHFWDMFRFHSTLITSKCLIGSDLEFLWKVWPCLLQNTTINIIPIKSFLQLNRPTPWFSSKTITYSSLVFARQELCGWFYDLLSCPHHLW